MRNPYKNQMDAHHLSHSVSTCWFFSGARVKRYLQVVQKPERTLLIIHVFDISSTSFCTTFLPQNGAKKHWGCIDNGDNDTITDLSDDFVLDFVEFRFRYGAVHISAMQVSDNYHPFFIPAIVYEPSCERTISVCVRLWRVITHLGLSGIKMDPKARMIPITHCNDKGILHDRFEFMKEQK